MKRIGMLLVVLCLALSVNVTSSYADNSVNAKVSDSVVIIDGEQVWSTGFKIQNNNYFRLRDLASSLSGTDSQFNISLDNHLNAIELLPGTTYVPDGAPRAPYYNPNKTYKAMPAASKILINGEIHAIQAYNIGGSNYFQLRDLAGLLKLDVSFNPEKNQIIVEPQLPEHAYRADGVDTAENHAAVSYFSRWSSPISSHLIHNSDGTFSSITVDENNVHIESYDRDYKVTASQKLPVELEYYGAFYSGKQYNYIAYGQDNKEENDNKEVIRVVRYDKSFNRIDSASVTGGQSYTIQPFRSGSGKMDENGDELVFHTSRLRYTTPDGLNHQSQLTLIINTATMRVTNDTGRFQKNHVSHSFDQYVRYDGKDHVLVDHGDAYPRSIVLHKGNGAQYSEVDLVPIPGSIGANATGVSVGGLEISSTHYLTTYNTVDHSKVKKYTSYELEGLEQDVRDIMIAAAPRTNLSAGAVKNITLAQYTKGSDKIGSIPKIVKIDNDHFIVLWQEFDQQRTPLGVKYVQVDGSGNMVGEVQAAPKFLLSDCEPIVDDNQLIWFTDKKGKRVFYTIPLA